MVTNQGFERPTIDELETQIQQNFLSKFSDGGINNPSFEPGAFLGALSSIIASIKDDLYQIAEDSYYALFISTASGVSLDRVAAPTVRINAKKAVADIDLTGTPTTIISPGTEFETEDGTKYSLDNEITLDGFGDGSDTVTALIAGISGNAPIGAIKFIPVPVAGLDTTTNPLPATGGAPIETDSNFRIRAIAERTADRTSSLFAIVNRVLEVSGVISTKGFENTENFIVDSRPASSFEMVVRGGADLDIATAIFTAKPAGMESFGTISTPVTAPDGTIHNIEFSRVTQISINVEVTVETNIAYVSVTAQPLIRQRVLDYIGGVNPALVESPGVDIAEDIFAWKCEGSIFELSDPDAIPGIENVTVLLAINPAAPSLTKIVIDDTEEAFTDFANIDIVEV